MLVRRYDVEGIWASVIHEARFINHAFRGSLRSQPVPRATLDFMKQHTALFPALTTSLVLLLLLLPARILPAWGMQEAEVEERILSGEIVEVHEQSNEWTRLTVLTEEDEEVFVEVPADMARNLRIREGDRFASRERLAVRPGARLRVLEFTIER